MAESSVIPACMGLEGITIDRCIRIVLFVANCVCDTVVMCIMNEFGSVVVTVVIVFIKSS